MARASLDLALRRAEHPSALGVGDLRDAIELWRGAYQIPLALPLVGRHAVHHGGNRLALRAASGAFNEAELDAFMRAAVPAALGRYAGRALDVPTLPLVGERDLALPTRTARILASGSPAMVKCMHSV